MNVCSTEMPSPPGWLDNIPVGFSLSRTLQGAQRAQDLVSGMIENVVRQRGMLAKVEEQDITSLARSLCDAWKRVRYSAARDSLVHLTGDVANELDAARIGVRLAGIRHLLEAGTPCGPWTMQQRPEWVAGLVREVERSHRMYRMTISVVVGSSAGLIGQTRWISPAAMRYLMPRLGLSARQPLRLRNDPAFLEGFVLWAKALPDSSGKLILTELSATSSFMKRNQQLTRMRVEAMSHAIHRNADSPAR